MSVRKRGPRAYQVRVAPFPAQTVPTREAAEKLELDLKLRKVAGAASPERPTTLGEEIDGFLGRLGAAGGLRPRSMEFYERKVEVWKPLRSVRVSALRRVQVEDFMVERAREHPRSAVDELQFLKRVLRESAGARSARRGGGAEHQAGEAHAETRPGAHGRGALRTRVVVPEGVSRLVLVAGQVGARQSFWFNLTDDMLDLVGGTMTIPAELAKNRREHRVYVTALEVACYGSS